MIFRILRKLFKKSCKYCGSTDIKITKVTEVRGNKEVFLEKLFECETCEKVYERK